jgi:hypothetical protein
MVHGRCLGRLRRRDTDDPLGLGSARACTASIERYLGRGADRMVRYVLPGAGLDQNRSPEKVAGLDADNGHYRITALNAVSDARRDLLDPRTSH